MGHSGTKEKERKKVMADLRNPAELQPERG